MLEIGVFETYDMLYFDLEIYSSAPTKDMGRRDDRRSKIRVN